MEKTSKHIIIMYLAFFLIIVIIAVLFISAVKQKRTATVYILYHDERSKDIANFFSRFPWAHFVKMGKSKYFESAFWPILYSRQHEWANQDYVGFISYSLVIKQSLTEFPLDNIIKQAKGADVISFYKLSSTGLIINALRGHRNFSEVWIALLTKMGFQHDDIMSFEMPFFPCNCWIAKPVWMRRFLLFAFKAMEILETDSKIRKLAYKNSAYTGKLSQSQLMAITGKPYYTFHPFIMERLPCFFFWIYGAKMYDTNVGFPIFNY
jgi:hypothetical protein